MTTAPGGAHTTPLPTSANAEHLKKQAKQLLHAFREGDSDATRLVAALHPKPETFTTLRDAQLVIARRYQTQDWQQLMQAVELQKLLAAALKEQAEQFVFLSCLHYGGDDRAWRYEQANALLKEVPQLVQVNLYCALVAGDLAAVKKYLDKNPALATQNGGPQNWPPLMYLTYSRVRASKQDVLGILHLLLSLGASPDSHVMLDGLYRFSALAGAMGEGERGPVDCPPHQHAEALVDALLEARASPAEFQGLYNTMFTDGLDTWLPKLIAHGLNVSHKTDPNNAESETIFDFILSQAAMQGRIKRLWILLTNGANANAVNRYNNRSAHTNAMLSGHPDCAAALLEYGAKPESLTIADQFSIACWQNDLARADELLKQNPSLAKDPQVFSNVARTHQLLAPWLIERGFNVNSQTRDGRTVLHRMAAGNELEEVKAMIALGADPNLTEYHFRGTPMGFALHNRAWDVVNYLKELTNSIFDLCGIAYAERVAEVLEANPQLVNMRTPMGNTPLHVLNHAIHEAIDVAATREVIRLLLASGADLKATNNEGLTPEQFRRKMGHDETADLLKEAS